MEGAYFYWLRNLPEARVEGAGRFRRGSPRQDEEISSETSEPGRRCRAAGAGRESGAGSGGPFLSFLFFLICLRSNFTF